MSLVLNSPSHHGPQLQVSAGNWILDVPQSECIVFHPKLLRPYTCPLPSHPSLDISDLPPPPRRHSPTKHQSLLNKSQPCVLIIICVNCVFTPLLSHESRPSWLLRYWTDELLCLPFQSFLQTPPSLLQKKCRLHCCAFRAAPGFSGWSSHGWT